MTDAAVEILSPGTVVKVVKDHDLDARQGIDYVILQHVAEDGDDPPTDCYEMEPAPGSGYWSSGDFAPVDAVEVVRSAAEQAERMKMPTPEELMRSVSSALHHTFGDDLEIDETQLIAFEEKSDFEFGVEFYGRRRDGVSFGGTLRLTGLWQTDD